MSTGKMLPLVADSLLVTEISQFLARRIFIAIAGICIIASALHMSWSTHQQSVLSARLMEGLAHTVQSDVEENDLISLKRTIQAFQISNPGAKFCLRLQDTTEVAESNCSTQYKAFSVPLVGLNYFVAVDVPPNQAMAVGGLLLLAFLIFISIYVLIVLKRLSRRLLSDVALLKSGATSCFYNFREFELAGKQIEDGLHARIEMERSRSSVELGKLAKQVSHDIRSPLSALSFALSTFDEADERIKLMSSASKRINKIAEDLLLNARGLKIHEVCSSQLEPMIKSLVQEKKSEFANQPDIKFDIDLCSDQISGISVDTSSLERALSNLINNSCESMSGRGVVRVSQKVDLNDLVISVTDNGKGIPDELLPSLGNSEVSFGKQGNGLGLSYAKRIAESSGGRIRIESRLGCGTTVSMRFPIRN